MAVNTDLAQLRRVYGYLVKQQSLAWDAGHSPFVASPEIADECKYFAEYYEDGINAVDDIYSSHFSEGKDK